MIGSVPVGRDYEPRPESGSAMGRAKRAQGLEASIRRRFRRHLRELGFSRSGRSAIAPPNDEKQALRALQGKRRNEHLREERVFIRTAFPRLAHHFADGKGLRPADIRARLQLIESGTEESELFRLASLTWGVPVSRGMAAGCDFSFGTMLTRN